MTEIDRAKIQTHKDYYYILGVSTHATSKEIQEAYDDLYQKFGPHVSMQGVDPEIFIKTYRDICDAYEVLMNPVARSQYDQVTAASRKGTGDLRALWTKYSAQTQAPAPSANPNSPSASAPPAFTPQEKKISAMGYEVEVEVSMKEAIKGCQRRVKMSDPTPCPSCAGAKLAGRMQCANCRGLGYYNTEREEDIELPPGLFDNMQLVLPDRGRFDLRAGRRGDLIVRVSVQPHPFLSVLGRDLTVTVPVTLYEAVLGAEIDVPTAVGKVVMKIQPLTHAGRVYRLKGLGLGGGDQLVTIDIVLPQHISSEEISLFRKLKDLSNEPNPRSQFFTKMPG